MLPVLYTDDEALRVSHETIYQLLIVQIRGVTYGGSLPLTYALAAPRTNPEAKLNGGANSSE